MRLLTWIAVAAWGAVFAASNLVLATCDYDCSDSGAIQGYLLVFVLTPAMVAAVLYLLRHYRNKSGRAVVMLVAAAYLALTAWMAMIFIGV